MWVSLSDRTDISGTTRAIVTKYLCILPVCVAQSLSDMFMMGRIAYRREEVFFPTDNAYISGITGPMFTKFLCPLPMSVARSSSNMFTIGRMAYRREEVFFP